MKFSPLLLLRLQLTAILATIMIDTFWVTLVATKLQEKRRIITTVKNNSMAIAGFK